MTEQEIVDKITGKFEFLKEKIKIQRVRRISADVPNDKFGEVLDFSVKNLGFDHLCTITGLDEGENLGFIYHIARPEGIILNLKISVSKSKPVIKTIIGVFPAADIYERELIDLLGAQVEGLPAGRRYPLDECWPKDQHPLRKDWKSPAPACVEPEKQEVK